MNREVFYEKLYKADIECILIDHEEINPIEIILLTEQKKRLVNRLGLADDSYIDMQSGKRAIRVVSFREMGIADWKQNLYHNATLLQQKVYCLSEEDLFGFYLYYSFVHSLRPSWLTRNIEKVVRDRLESAEKSSVDLKTWFKTYLEGYGYTIVPWKPVRVEEVRIEKNHWFHSLVTQVTRLRIRIQQRLPLEFIILELFFHRIGNRMYIRRLIATELVGMQWSLLKGESGASGAVLVKCSSETGDEFIKGHGLGVYNGVRNEIIAQIRLVDRCRNQSWYLPMIKYDPGMRWIAYPYIEQMTLDRMLSTRLLHEDELARLGAFLICTLDNLFACGIIHNDMRADNIAIYPDTQGKIIDYRVLDFGCASCDGNHPWKVHTYLGKYVARAVCGDYRFNSNIIDDAATAYAVYLEAGGSCEDKYAVEIRNRIGRIYYFFRER